MTTPERAYGSGPRPFTPPAPSDRSEQRGAPRTASGTPSGGSSGTRGPATRPGSAASAGTTSGGAATAKQAGAQAAKQSARAESDRDGRDAREAPRAPQPRRVRLFVSRVDPWSVMKLSFLLSVAVGIALVVMVAVLWMILDGMGVFTDLDRVIGQVMGGNAESDFDFMSYVGFGRVLSLTTVIGVVDVILLTALSTLAAFLYNVCASLVGGVQVTLSDD